jgi:D-alanyl-lipoteichoic acid acyltransferase DltB (MBOAT superfamily)
VLFGERAVCASGDVSSAVLPSRLAASAWSVVSFVSFFFAVFYAVALGWRLAAPSGTRLYALGLLGLSWLFYAWHAPLYLSLLILTTSVDYVVARLLGTHHRSPGGRRAILLTSLALNVGLLGYFKYFGLIARTGAADAAGSSAGIGAAHALLPIGISFYTFMSMSYTIDVYRRRLQPERDFIRFAAYLAFFPHLVAGPIVRGGEFLYQFARRRRLRAMVFAEGAYLIVRGLFLKVVVADNLGQIIDRHWQAAAVAGGDGALAFTILVFFAGQLFADFAGYTDIARGLSYQLGFRLPINFNAPYLAGTFVEFWRRWNITLSSWMRDYLYIPLGGSADRCGR